MIDGFKIIGDALVAVLQAGTYSTAPNGFTRRNRLQAEGEHSTKLEVYVMPNARGLAPGTRRGVDATYGFRIALLQRLSDANKTAFEASIDDLNKLVDELAGEVFSNRAISAVYLQGIEDSLPSEPFDQDLIHAGIFYAAFDVTYAEFT